MSENGWNEKDRSYLAGFFDGEGSISIQEYNGTKSNGQKRKELFLQVSATNADPLPIARFWAFFGGYVTTDPRIEKGYKRIYLWRVQNKKALPVLKFLLPALQVKKLQAEIGIEFQERVSNDVGFRRRYGLNKDEILIRNKIKEDLCKINHASISTIGRI